MKYKIGDVSKILGISPDLLRYYQKKGVVTPTLGDNGYRYYDAWDINFLIDCLWFKNFGFGIEQTAKLVSGSTVDDILSDMEKKEDEIRASMQREKLLLKRSAQYRAGMNRARTMLGKCDLVYSPEIYCFLNRHNHDYDRIHEQQDLSHQWLDYTPFINRFFEIEQKDLEDGTENYAWGFSMGMEYVNALGVPLDDEVTHVLSEPSIHAVFTSSGKTSFSPKRLDFVMEYARLHGLTVTGNARGILICSVMEGKQLTGFFEVWVPVEPKEGLVFKTRTRTQETTENG